MSIWRASRPRLAPKAERMANSLSRAAARAMSRLITFAQAISRTASTALNKIHATNRTSCIWRSRRDRTRRCTSLRKAGGVRLSE